MSSATTSSQETVETVLDCLCYDFTSYSDGQWWPDYESDFDRFQHFFNPSHHARAKDDDGISFLRRIIWIASDWRTDIATEHGPRPLRNTAPLVNICRRLLEHGADPDGDDINVEGESLLTEYFQQCDNITEICPAVVDLLLEFGANVNYANWRDETSLLLLLRAMVHNPDQASEHEQSYLRMVQCLLKAGADPNHVEIVRLLKYPQRLVLLDSARHLLRAHGARSMSEHKEDMSTKRALSRSYPWNLPSELSELILAYAFQSDYFYDFLFF